MGSTEQGNSHTVMSRIFPARSTSAIAVFLFLSLAVFFRPAPAQAAVMSLSPSGGTFIVGSTFTVSVLLNTEGESVNTIGTTISFPADKLQLVSPSTGNSIISLWTSLPQVDNLRGTVTLQGGIPGGIKVSNGVITTLTFRVKSVGTAVVKFTDKSKVLLNDGQGSDALKQTTNGVYILMLPPPAGPQVVSETHPDQSRWYSNPTLALLWSPDAVVEGYSYIINSEPVDIPDDISEGNKTSLTYRKLGDGVHYFHIKALKDGNWGGTTHFAVKVDTIAPAGFPIEVIPNARTTRKQPIVQFSTTDNLSGIDHYELKVVPLLVKAAAGESATGPGTTQPIFIDMVSPYVLPELQLGKYDIIVRVYDNAGNFQESVQHLAIVAPLFTVISELGLRIGESFTITWLWLWLILGAILIVLIYGAWRVRQWHRRILRQQIQRELPRHVKTQLDELMAYRAKYGKALVAALLFFTALLLWSGSAKAAQSVEITPPIITTISRDISNNEIFYIGGKIDTASTTVIIYLQNISTGKTVSETVISDKRGEWFYRHDAFLTSGSYLLWVQSKLGQSESPPSPQVQLKVHTTAFQIGAARFSIESIYAALFLAALAVVIFLTVYIVVHALRGKKHLARVMKEISEAEESVRRGFAVLRRDIQAELQVIHNIKKNKELSPEERAKEDLLMKDLDEVEKYIGKEIWDIERVESA